ncbi:MAG TPA: hypothetical protein VKX45_05970 [Bryobacteraceae bacterium]|nr:hypothetical protein [Bryobacteraceae bacterium]
MLLLLAAALPSLLWDGPPDTAAALRQAGIERLQVPAAQYESWKSVGGLAVEAAHPDGAVQLTAPGVQYRANVASATTTPWLVSNAWRILRNPRGRFVYDAQGAKAALAAAEASCFGADAAVHTDAAGLKPFAEIVSMLRAIGPNGPPVADIGFIDDGSPAAGEVINLLVRDNLLVKLVAKPDPAMKLNVSFGSKEFPKEEAGNPPMMAHDIRGHLTDERRSLRIFGSAVVVARLTAAPDGVRVHLLNYAGAERKIDGLRVRVLGRYPKSHVTAAGSPADELLDYTVDTDATEFTIRELKTYAVIDLAR